MDRLRGVAAALFMAVNTVFWSTATFVMAVVRVLLPRHDWRVRWAAVMNGIIDGWVSGNRWLFRHLLRVRFDVRGTRELRRDDWYLVISNHQSWTDIVVLQTLFRDLVPPLKFFTKQQLLWLPFLGFAMWALDFPFMRRYSREYLEQHPEMRGRDLETTREKCERFRPTPTAIIIFIEGTRNMPARHDAQASPYRNLLRPRAGGVGFVLGAMGDQLDSLVDVTLAYPDGTPSFWDFLCGRVDRVIMDVQLSPLPENLAGGDYVRDEAYRLEIQEWITELWRRKDARIDALKNEDAESAPETGSADDVRRPA
ncbi:MAG: acyltransferase [Gammaproteobacteria bacterium]|nr:acyltransferase [Gammaproteobacteria bacterium]